ncbi:hypothetical protein [Sinosporangium siamense]|uniref:Lipoprotein n=1 Tax=Sinosporangium siamense TaxID=1367973 RepID=A0A919RKL5_9ACTN|nr:hypothetical protein [Sinosporangium siamense]GII94565.1 hypothetical protein Ssi02_47960 [Sinosporangium siamense]
MRLAPLVLAALVGVAGCGGASTDAGTIAAGLGKEGLPVHTSVTYTAENDPEKLLGADDGYESKVAFQDERAMKKAGGAKKGDIREGGIVEVFPGSSEASARIDAIKAKLNASKQTEYYYIWDNVVLRLSPLFSEEQAERYSAALQKIVG